jgi:glycogen debranching enzyme
MVDPASATFAGRSADTSLFVRRSWTLGAGAQLEVEIRHRGGSARWVEVALLLRSDLADLFAVKEGGSAPVGETTVRSATPDELRFDAVDGRRGALARVLFAGPGEPVELEDGLAWKAQLDRGGIWRCRLELAGVREGREVQPSPTRSWASVHRRSPARIDTDIPGLRRTFGRSIEDLDALRLVDPEHPDDVVIAAGAPWFMTLFGRDSLLTSWMALPVDPTIGLATARTLARLQGSRVDPETDEQPGRILHEVRLGAGPTLSLADAERYYGTADATPLFVMLVHELWRWGLPWPQVETLLPAVDAAMRWLIGPGDPDGDGFVEYQRATSKGLVNQGWKDSWDSIAFADGTLAEAPVALAEVQGYVYAACRAASELSAAAGDHVRAAQHADRAVSLQQSFDEAFWLPDARCYALALDAQKRPVDAVASNLGHLLWCDIVPPKRTSAVADVLVSRPMRSGWGLRTLATTMTRYDPLGYHTGSVWPHDTAIAVAGLRRAGHADDAARLASDLLLAADALAGRLPELFAGLTTVDFPVPVPYPASCSPQAWASAAPLMLVRALLGLDVDLPNHRISLDPVLPDGCARLHFSGVRLADHAVSILVEGDSVAFRDLPRGISVELR